MKKKLTAFALALSLILACTACTSEQSQQSAQPSSSPSSAPGGSESTAPATVDWPNGNVEIYLPINGGTVTDAAGARPCGRPGPGHRRHLRGAE